MSDTIADVKVGSTEYLDLNTDTGILAGTAIAITNKSNSVVLLQISALQPAADSLDGVPLSAAPDSTGIKIVTAGENTVWAISSKSSGATISVQDNT